MKYHYLCAVGVYLTLCPTIILAETEREHESHEHGASKLNVVLEGEQLFLEFESPWNNLAGFEHQPSTPEQEHIIKAVVKDFNTPQLLFDIEGGGCEIVTQKVNSSMSMLAETNNEHEEHEEHKEHKEHTSHSELTASYSYHCKDVISMQKIQVKLFQHWSGIESITVQMIGEGGQAAQTLTASESSIALSAIR